MARSQAVPVLVRADNVYAPLERIHLGNGSFTESWLQELIYAHPGILPISDIEPGFGELIAAAREVPCGHGIIDNLYLTPTGDIVLIETKLWRNSQMRREVVGQVLDYVAALTSMSFEVFEAAIIRGRSAPKGLYDLVADNPEALDEQAFIDAVSLNLQRGRMLAIVLGDGIRSETEALSGLLQSHAGAHFTFALVELATWRNSETGDLLAIPSTLARTVMIERGVVRLEQGRAVIGPVPQDVPQKAQSISMAQFWEKLAEQGPALPAAVRAFLAALEPLGVYADLKASLNLKVDLADCEKPINFGYITRNGQFWTNPVAWCLPERIWRHYSATVAELVGGTVINDPGITFVAVKGRSAPRIGQLLPAHQDAFVAAIATVIHSVNDANANNAEPVRLG